MTTPRWAPFFRFITNGFPVWVVLGGIIAYLYPPSFAWFQGPWIIWGLGVIMLGMGVTLSFADFRRVLVMPRPIVLGVLAQFSIMPFLGWGIASALRMPQDFAVGLILVSCCPGGTASNVVAFLARANLPLSVLMTMCSTFGAIALTPILTDILVGARAEVDAWKMFLTTLKVVLAPVLTGVTLNHYFPKSTARVSDIAPAVSALVIVLICASIIGRSAEVLRDHFASIITAVLLLHSGGFFLGYCVAKLFGYDEQIRRTVSIEVGMQNSGLGSALATKHFTLLAAAPCSLSAALHSVIGSLLAWIWRNRPADRESTRRQDT